MTNLPADLRSAERRGPVGTEVMGVSLAIPLKECSDWSQEDWSDFVRESMPQLLTMLENHVGHARPATEPQVNVDGPHADPLQGQLYVMTCSAWFAPQSLPVDCTAYRAWTKDGERRG